MMESSGLTEDDLPAVVMPGSTLKQATPGALADKLGLSYRRPSTKPVDVTIVGAGPAGLAAAVYGASEGLDTVLLDAVGTGGQAAASSRIENYFGFPFGLSGADLTGLAVLQALKFGAQLASPCQAVRLDTDRNGDLLRLHLQGGEVIDSKAVVIATGARYRVLPWSAGLTSRAPVSTTRPPNWKPGRARAARSRWSAARTPRVRRRCTWPGEAVRSRWSSAARISRPRCRPISSTGCWPIPRVTVRCRSEVTRLDGGDFLQEVSITDRTADSTQAQPCSGCSASSAPNPPRAG